MCNSHRTSSARTRRKSVNTAIRLLAVLFILVFGFLSLRNSGFFDKTINYNPVSTIGYTAPVNVTDDASYYGSGIFGTVSGDVGREKFTKMIGDGTDKFTVMIYMCGSDLESEQGLASADIDEMLSATYSSNLNIVIQTGGTLDWTNNKIPGEKTKRYTVSKGKLTEIATGGKINMTNYANLTSFIIYSKNKFPANRYALVLWGHGGDTSRGFGYDEMTENGDSMSIDELDKALYASGVKFDFIGFDCPLMATYETAHTVNKYADYLIASQDMTSSAGWNYSGWLSAISENSSINTCELGKIIIDDYAEDAFNEYPDNAATLSLIDLVDFDNLVVPAINSFFKAVDKQMNNGNYSAVSKARNSSRQFGGSTSDLIDLMEFAARIDSSKSGELIDALKAAVKYNAASKITVNANGLSVYIPFNDMSDTGTVIDIMHRVDISEEYLDAIRKFANITFGGRNENDSVSDKSDTSSTQITDITSEESQENRWIDNDFIKSCETYYKINCLSEEDVFVSDELTASGDVYKAFSPSEDKWSMISDIHVEAYTLNPESGKYVYLGTDIPSLTYMTESKKNLLVDFPTQWLSINNVNVFAQAISIEKFNAIRKITYRIPVLITPVETVDEKGDHLPAKEPYYAMLSVIRDNRENRYSDSYSIAYAEKIYSENMSETTPKIFQLSENDVITPLYSEYDSPSGEVISDVNKMVSFDSFEYSDDITVSRSSFSSDTEIIAYYVFTDIYGNTIRRQAEISD